MTERLEVARLERPVNDLARLDLGAEVRPAWLTGEVRLPVASIASGLSGEPIAHVVIGDERFVAIARDGDRIRFGFDPVATRGCLATEAYLPSAKRPIISRVPRWYRALPGSWRLRLHGGLTRRHADEADRPGFPGWPVEPAGAVLCEILKQYAGWPRPTWPDGACCAVSFCHDVDTRKGLRCLPAIRDVEVRAGVQSGWAVVATQYDGHEGLLDEVRADGHEVLCHGLRHDFRLPYLPPEAIARRLDRCRPMIERFDVTGFRSPGMLMAPALRKAIADRFSYDTSVPDTAVRTPIGARRGCALVEPFVAEGLLELPLTLPLEDTLLLMGYDARGILDLWRRKVAWLKSVGGFAMITTHCERHLGARTDLLAVYADLVREVADDGEMWIATPGDIARHWRGQRDEGWA